MFARPHFIGEVAGKGEIEGIGEGEVAGKVPDEGLGEVEIEASGLPEPAPGSASLLDLLLDAVLRCVEGLPRARRRDADFVEDAVEKAARAAVNGLWGKKPKVHVLVVRV